VILILSFPIFIYAGEIFKGVKKLHLVTRWHEIGEAPTVVDWDKDGVADYILVGTRDGYLNAWRIQKRGRKIQFIRMFRLLIAEMRDLAYGILIWMIWMGMVNQRLYAHYMKGVQRFMTLRESLNGEQGKHGGRTVGLQLVT
jgi:hypothetical protein